MYSQRISSLRKVLADSNLDAFLITNFFNIFYLTGVKTLVPEEREAFVLITKEHVYFFTDARYIGESLDEKLLQVGAELRLLEVKKRLIPHLQEICRSDNVATLAVEEEDIKFIEYTQIKGAITEIKITPLKQIVLSLRAQKDSSEVEAVKKACEITDDCLRDFTKVIKVGVTEKELAWKMEVWIREKGYELGFAPMIAVNENAAVPHYDTKTGNSKVEKDSLILVDCGVNYQNYVSDITRMFFVGTPSTEIWNAYEGLRNAQEKTVANIKKGKSYKSIDTFCREQLVNQKLPDFMHSTGHGVGIEVHELPKVSSYSSEMIVPNHIITIEPGVYIPRKFGMRLEDTVWIDDSFVPHTLTNFTRELVIL